MVLDISKCTTTIRTTAHYDYPRIMKYVHLDAIHPKEGKTGSLVALRVERDWCAPGDFLDVMDRESEECSAFAYALFNRFGRLKPELVENEHLKGSGVWGRELDTGAILFVLDTRAEKQHEWSVVAPFLLQELARSEFASPRTFFFVWPIPPMYLALDEEREQKCVKVLNVFRKCHYRRVGRTSVLCYAPDPAHPSRALAKEDDVESHIGAFQYRDRPTLAEDCAFVHRIQRECDQAKRDEEYPLHSMIDPDPLLFGYPMPEVVDDIRSAYSQDPTLVRRKDDRGFTPLHAAAYAGNAVAVRTLLGLPAASAVDQDLRRRDNNLSRTPLELCEYKINDIKERAQTRFGIWAGHKASALRAIYLLKEAAGEHMALTEDEFVAQREWGCTCGQCTDGWLSPRMRYRLSWEAETTPDTMDDICSMYVVIPSDSPAMSHLPPEILQKGVRKPFYRDYAAVMRAISRVLGQPGMAGLPTAANVQTALHGETSCFFVNGGRVEHAMDYVLYSAMEQSLCGDATWDQLLEDLVTDGSPEGLAYAGMPTCDNDLDFIRVAERLKLGTHGRYWVRTDYGGNDRDEMDDEDEEDEDEDDEDEDGAEDEDEDEEEEEEDENMDDESDEEEDEGDEEGDNNEGDDEDEDEDEDECMDEYE